MTADNTEPRCQLRWAENRQKGARGIISQMAPTSTEAGSCRGKYSTLTPATLRVWNSPCSITPCGNMREQGWERHTFLQEPEHGLAPTFARSTSSATLTADTCCQQPASPVGWPCHEQDRCIVIAKQPKWQLLISQSWGSADALSELTLTSFTIRIPLHFSFLSFFIVKFSVTVTQLLLCAQVLAKGVKVRGLREQHLQHFQQAFTERCWLADFRKAWLRPSYDTKLKQFLHKAIQAKGKLGNRASASTLPANAETLLQVLWKVLSSPQREILCSLTAAWVCLWQNIPSLTPASWTNCVQIVFSRTPMLEWQI